MSNTALVDQIRGIFAEALEVEVDAVPAELEFGGIPEWDSMGHMEVMMLLEEHLNVDINPDTISALVSIPLIYEHVNGAA